MARPTASEELTESTEYLKRRFIRQNRELARINAAQAIQLRAMEVENSRLLAENIALQERLIHLEREAGKEGVTDEDAVDSNPGEETRATKPERVAPEVCLETINEEFSPVRVSYIRRPPRREKPYRSPKARELPIELPPDEETRSQQSKIEEEPTEPCPIDQEPAKKPTTKSIPVTKSPFKDSPVLEQPPEEQPIPRSPILPSKVSSAREPLAPKARRAARVSYVEPSLKKKMRRSDIYANAVKT